MLTSREITDLIASPKSGGMAAGRVAYLHARENRNRNKDPRNSSPAQLKFLDDLNAQRPATPPATIDYRHPAATPLPHRDKGAPLSPSELAWLQRLPTDPTQMPHEDARVLAAMSNSLSPLSNAADSRLVESIWRPVREFHDANVARLRIDAAKQPPPPIPSSALNALADAVAAENDQLAPHEAIARASAMLSEAAATRNAAHETRLADANARAAELDQSARNRTAVTK